VKNEKAVKIEDANLI